jgi:hypothetical protein
MNNTELDASIEHALRVTREIEARLDEQEQETTEEMPPPSDEDVARLRAFILGYARTPEWQPVIDRIDDGALTWRQVYEAPFGQRADQQITAAFESLSRVLPPSEEKLVEIGVVQAEEPEEPAPNRGRRIVNWPN